MAASPLMGAAVGVRRAPRTNPGQVASTDCRTRDSGFPPRVKVIHVNATRTREALLLADRALELFKMHHDEIIELLAEADQIMVRNDPDRNKSIALLRWQLLRALRNYQLFKHTEVFDPLSRDENGARAAQARSMKARCITIGEQYHAHVQKWSLHGDQSFWQDYQREAVAMVRKLRQHLAEEAAGAARLMAGVTRTRRP